MAYSDNEVKRAYLEDITKYCPKGRRIHGVWRNTVVKRGNITPEMVDFVKREREHGQQ